MSTTAHRAPNSVNSRAVWCPIKPAPVPLMSYYAAKYGFRKGRFPVSEWLSRQTISLPVAPHIEPDDADYIGTVFKKALHAARDSGRKAIASNANKATSK